MKTLLILIALVLVGCGDTKEKLNKAVQEYSVYQDTIAGHVYLTSTVNLSGISTIHAEHCSCKVVK